VQINYLWLWYNEDERRRIVTNLLDRITFDKDILTGKPIIRGMRISVDMILELLAKGTTTEEILEDYPQLEADDLRAALLYAHYLVSGETILERIAA
jgi:uncharacterized protein (DUF433 family)